MRQPFLICQGENGGRGQASIADLKLNGLPRAPDCLVIRILPLKVLRQAQKAQSNRQRCRLLYREPCRSQWNAARCVLFVG